MLIRIETGDWLKNASIVGMYKVLNKIQPKHDSVKKGTNYIEFDSSLLKKFAEGYFDTIADEYRDELTYFKIIDKPIDSLKTINDINDFIEYTRKKITSSSYKSAYHLANRDELLQYFKSIQKIKTTKNSTKEEIKESIENAKIELKEIQNILSDKTLKKYITAKNAMYQVITNFFENKSFMLNSKSSLDMYELYQKDFIDKALKYEAVDKSKFKYNCSCCERPIKNLDTNFSWLCEQGVDVNRKTNHFWDGVVDLFMCDTCALLYSCACLGFNKKFNKGIFINNNKSVDDLIQTNLIKAVDNDKINNVEALAYFNIINYMDIEKVNSIEYEFDNIQVVTMNTNNKRVFEFSMLTKKLLYLIYKNRKNIKKTASSYIQISENQTLQVFDEVMNRLYLNKTLYDLVNTLFSYHLSDSKKISIYVIEAVQEIEGGKRMSQKEIESFKALGLNLKVELISRKLEGKLSSLNYKLINALRTNNVDRFLDTILDIHMYLKKDVPGEILKVKFDDVSFSDFGYSYLVGLNLELKKAETNDSENNLEEDNKNEK